MQKRCPKCKADIEKKSDDDCQHMVVKYTQHMPCRTVHYNMQRNGVVVCTALASALSALALGAVVD